MTHGPFVHPTRPSLQIGPFEMLGEAESEALIAETLAGVPDPNDFWVFAYGSLIWNPCFEPMREAVARVEGMRRRFCFWTVISRGSPDRPGLGMGLAQNPASRCAGILQRMNPKTVEADFKALWEREMLSGVYRPTWVDAKLYRDAGSTPMRALTFVVDTTHPQCARDLTPEEEIAIIATAAGKRGPCAEYLVKLVDALDKRGIDDPEIRALHDGVSAFTPETGAAARR